MTAMMNNPKTMVTLLRAMAGSSDAARHRHDIILYAAANMIENGISEQCCEIVGKNACGECDASFNTKKQIREAFPVG